MASIRKTKKRLKRDLAEAMKALQASKGNFALTEDLFYKVCHIEYQLLNMKTIKQWIIVRVRKPTASDKVALTMTLDEYLRVNKEKTEAK